MTGDSDPRPQPASTPPNDLSLGRPSGAFVAETLEIRWFARGLPPAGVVAWAEARGLTRSDAREDLYVLLPGAGTVGIKLREGRVEVKARTEESIPWRVHALAGHLERWAKWSQPVGVVAGWGEGPDVHMVRVEKERWARWANGRLMEVTSIRVEGQEWWTLAVEHTDLQAQPGDLERVLQELGEMPGIAGVVTADNSMSYPEWLTGLFAARSLDT